MKVIIPLTGFVHGSLNAHEGRAVEVDDYTAQDLEKAGLVRIRADAPVNKAAAGKGSDDGEGQPSSVSPPAPASAPPTSSKSARGEKKVRKTAK